MPQKKLLLLVSLLFVAAFTFSCGGDEDDEDSPTSSTETEDCSVEAFSIADSGGVLLLPGDQDYSRAVFGANGQLLWVWDQTIGHLNSDFEFEWILDASAELGLTDRSLSFTVADSGKIYASGQTSSYGAGDVDTWLCEYSCSGEVVSGTQVAFGSLVDESNVFLFSDVHLNKGFDLEDTSGEAHVHWLNGIHIPDPDDPADMHAIVGRIDNETGTEWVRTADLDAGGFITWRAYDGGSISMATRNTGDEYDAIYEGYLTHLASNGDVQWEVSTEEEYDTFSMTGRLHLDDGRFLITGSSKEDSDPYRALAIAVGESGPEWSLSVTDDGNTTFEGALQLPGGDIIAYGSVEPVHGDHTWGLLVRMDTDGDIVWQRSYGDALVDYDIDQVAYMPGGYLAVLASFNWGDAWVAGISLTGVVQWQHQITPDNPLGGSFELVDPSETESYSTSSVMVFGERQDIGFSSSLETDMIAIVIDSSGSVDSAYEWANSQGGQGPTVYTDENTGSLYLFAEVENPAGAGGQDGILVQYDATLELAWSNLYGGPDDDSISHLDFNEDGEILLSGLTSSFDSTDDDPFILGLGLDGETTQACWVHAVTPSSFTDIWDGLLSTVTLFLDEDSLTFVDVNILQTPDYIESVASHTISSTSETLNDSCE